MILTFPINPEMRIRLAHVEAIKLDISGHPDLAELKADLVAAHAHIEHLHSIISNSVDPLPLGLVCTVMNWEKSQC